VGLVEAKGLRASPAMCARSPREARRSTVLHKTGLKLDNIHQSNRPNHLFYRNDEKVAAHGSNPVSN